MSDDQRPAPESVIAPLVDEFTDRLNRGEAPDPEDYADRNPEFREEIRDVLGTLSAMRQARHQSKPDEQFAETLGDYRILGELGRGGMAVVFEAEHQSLKRRVALKVMEAAAHDGSDVRRFEREARAAARLHHTNIVPIFETGSFSGKHFIAMQFIDGVSLDRIARDTSNSALAGEATDNVGAESTEAPLEHSTTHTSSITQVRQQPAVDRIAHVASIGQQAAEAISHAHAHGVLHRDIKPSNLLLDRSGTVWLTDFGLASTAEDAVTKTGDIVGTVRYMGPERFRGECDQRSDIYSLGVALYELLAGRPPFESKDRLQLVRAISDGNPPRLGAQNDAIPKDLQTIVHKAIARAPADRYPTAAAMAEDLRRFLNDEPIVARRQSTGERLVRWGRRNPAIAMLTIGLIVSVIVGASAFGWQFHKLQTAKNTAEERRRQAEEARSLEALVADFMAHTFRTPIPEADGRDVRVVDMLDDSRAELLAAQEMHPVSRGTLLAAIGAAYYGLGQYGEARVLLTQALDILPVGHEKRLHARLKYGELQADQEDVMGAIATLETLVEDADRILGPDHRTTLGSRVTLAAVYRQTGRVKEAIPQFEELLVYHRDRFGDRHPDTVAVVTGLGSALIKARRADEAVDLLTTNLKHARELDERGRKQEVFRTLNVLGLAYVTLKQGAEAQTVLDEALERTEGLLGPTHAKRLEILGNLAGAHYVQGNVETAIDYANKSLANPTEHPNLRIQKKANLAGLYQAAGRTGEAVPLFREAWQFANQNFGPNFPLTRKWRANLASGLEADGQFKEAIAIYREIDRAGYAKDKGAAENLLALGRALVKDSEAAEAEKHLREARRKWGKDGPHRGRWLTAAMDSWLAASLTQQQKTAEVERLLLRAESIFRAEERLVPTVRKPEITLVYRRLADYYTASSNVDKAAEWQAKLDATSP